MLTAKTQKFQFWLGEKIDILYHSKVVKAKNGDTKSMEKLGKHMMEQEQEQQRVCGNEQDRNKGMLEPTNSLEAIE